MRKRRRLAYTLVELLVAIMIMATLLGLFLPAVMRARNAAHKTSCTNNLRQIGMALHNFESRHGTLPGSYWGYVGEGAGQTKWSFSPSSAIAADIESQALADKVKLQKALDEQDPDWDSLGLPAPGVLKCPSDYLATDRCSSYRYCRGVIPKWPRDPGGTFVDFLRGYPLAAITDGLSNTAFASERLISAPRTGWPDRQRDFITIGDQGVSGDVASCISLNQLPAGQGSVSWSLEPAGNAWMSGRWIQNSYYHLFPPNSRWIDCRTPSRTGTEVITARSRHDNGVNVLLGDGHVRFVLDTINLELWRGLATRAGGDLSGGD